MIGKEAAFGVGVGLVALGAVYVAIHALKTAGGAGALAQGAAGLVGDAGVGAVKGIGSWFGIDPQADMTCADFSFNCTPSAAVNHAMDQIRQWGNMGGDMPQPDPGPIYM